MAIGLDTSVVLRLLIGEPRAQAGVARRRIERALILAPGFGAAARGAAGRPDAATADRLDEIEGEHIIRRPARQQAPDR